MIEIGGGLNQAPTDFLRRLGAGRDRARSTPDIESGVDPVATGLANGKTIVERDTWTAFFNHDGSREVGLTVHIQGPGGIVVRDAGQTVRDADGNFLYLRGPHEQFSNVSFCPALTA